MEFKKSEVNQKIREFEIKNLKTEKVENRRCKSENRSRGE
jgi:hypothetical protein